MLKKIIWGKIVYFYIFWPLEIKTLAWGQIWRQNPGRAVNGLSISFFRAALAREPEELDRRKKGNDSSFTALHEVGRQIWPQVNGLTSRGQKR